MDNAWIPLWPNGAPGAPGNAGEETVRVTDQGDHVVANVHDPSLLPYLQKDAHGPTAAVVVMPGGAHREMWMDHEGYRVAAFLQGHGIAAFILKYRLAKHPNSTYTIEGTELGDVQRAIRTVRSRAAEWNVDPDRIGLIGFSAGGELAALAETRFDAGKADAADPIDHASCKPDFAALMYPVMPSDMPVSKDTPPTFLVCGSSDTVVSTDAVVDLFQKLSKAGASAELHMFAGGWHGFGIRDTNPKPIADWPQLFYEWIGARGFLKTN